MDPCHGGDESPNYHVRMPQIRHVLLCIILLTDVDCLIAGKRVVHHFDAGRGYESIEVLRLRDNFSHRSIVSLRQFAPHEVEIEFGQTPFGSVIPDRFRI